MKKQSPYTSGKDSSAKGAGVESGLSSVERVDMGHEPRDSKQGQRPGEKGSVI